MSDVKQAVIDVFGQDICDNLWTNNLYRAIMVTIQAFSIQAVLPAVFYMFRWGKRRGLGEFGRTFGVTNGDGRKKPPTSANVVDGLLAKDPAHLAFNGFNDEHTKTIINDLLVAFCFENKSRKEGHDVELQRVYPTHYFSSWIDLPKSSVNLRFVPELIAILLAHQKEGKKLTQTLNTTETRFPWASNFERNLLFQKFGNGVNMSTIAGDLGGDSFDDISQVTIDQLLTIRIAQACQHAPQTLRGEVSEVPNAWPLASKAAKVMRKDIATFIERYAETLPRQTFISLLETMLGFGLFQILINTAKMTSEWDTNGHLKIFNEQDSPAVFADASCGIDRELRQVAEESFSNSIMDLMARSPKSFMALRIMDMKGKYNRELRAYEPQGPDATDWFNLLGEVRRGRHKCSELILNDLDERCLQLSQKAAIIGTHPHVAKLLSDQTNDVVGKLAIGLSALLGRKNQYEKFLAFIDSCLILNAPNGFGVKRRVRLAKVVDGKRTVNARSIILSNSLLEALVHRHLVPDNEKTDGASNLSLPHFIEIIKRYGIFIDQAPLEMQIPDYLLRRNREFLERRLRDLGILCGVNDAESMKLLRPRYKMSETVI